MTRDQFDNEFREAGRNAEKNGCRITAVWCGLGTLSLNPTSTYYVRDPATGDRIPLRAADGESNYGIVYYEQEAV